MSAKEAGIIGEAEALRRITEMGMTPLCKNYRRAGGEIDIVAKDGETIVFIEVKARMSPRFGAPAEAISPAKRRAIARAALTYLKENKLLDSSARFDVITIEGGELNYIKAAFDATGLL